jgi:hypothetical protein
MDRVFSEPVRAWLYRVGMAVVPLLVTYGLLDEGTSGLWVGVLGAALGFGVPALAAANTSTSSTKGNDNKQSNGYPS